jgi:hypothetical protein
VATVTVVNAERTLEIEAANIIDGEVNAAGHLILERHDGALLDLGAVSGVQVDPGTGYVKTDVFSYVGTTDPGAVPDGSVWFDPTDVAGPFASETQKGLVELATTAETEGLADGTRAITPAGLASTIGALDGRLDVLEVYKNFLLTSNSKAETDTPNSYSVGTSYMTATTSSGWSLNAGFGLVVTQKTETSRVTQTFYVNASSTTITPRSWVRHGISDGSAWTAWNQHQNMYTLNPANFAQTTGITGYPLGWSRLYYTSANSSAWDFSGNSGEVLTYVDGTDYAKQTFVTHSSGAGTPNMWIRTANAANGWTAWRKAIFREDAGIPKAMASGTLTITPVANTPTSQAVSFPAGRFSSTPHIVISPITTVPGTQVTGWGASGASSTGFDAYVTRTNTTATILNWIATQF